MAWQALAKVLAKKVAQQVASKAGEKASNTGALASIKAKSSEHTPDSIKHIVSAITKVAQVYGTAGAIKGGYNAVKNGGMGGTAYAGEADSGIVGKESETPAIEVKPEAPTAPQESMASKIGGGTLAAMGSAIKASSPVLAGIYDDVQKRIIKRQVEDAKTQFSTMLANSGADQTTIDVFKKLPVKDAGELTSVVKNIQEIFANTPAGEKQKTKNKVDETIEIEKAKLSPEIVEAEMNKKGKEIQLESEKKDIETSLKLGAAVNRMSLIMDQFNEALPSGDKTAIQQRFAGQMAEWGARTGIKPNPKLLAIMSNSRPMAINLVRLFGEVGNLSEPEQKAALDTVNLKGLTDVERMAKVKQFAEYSMAGASPKAVEALLKKPSFVDAVSNLGIKIPGYKIQTNKKNGKTRIVAL